MPRWRSAASLAADPALTLTYAQLSGATAAVLEVAEGKIRPLDSIAKVAAGPYRILQLGTSIANTGYSPNKVIVAGLQARYGMSTMKRVQGGLYGGSADSPVSGWSKQPYSGVMYVRAKGTSSSTAISGFSGYGDQVVIEWSRESDSATTEVLVDGVSAGFFGAAGDQRYGMRTIFTVTKGAHTVTVNPPASGACYLEAVEIRDSGRRGVETIDGTFGGSSLLDTVTRGASGNQIAGITAQTGAGIQALFGRDDVDAILASFTVNDAGRNPGDPTAADFRSALESACVASGARGVPLVWIVEPAGHYAIPNDAGSTANNIRYEACKAHIKAMPALYPHVVVADWDTPSRISDLVAYAATWYPAVSAINLAAGTYSGDWTHPDGTLTNSSQDLGKAALAAAIGVQPIAPTAKYGPDIALVTGASAKSCMQVKNLGTDPAWDIGPVYRDTAATNLFTATNTLVSAAGTSDGNGKYYLASSYNIAPQSTSAKRMFVFRFGPAANGNFSVQGSSTGIRFWDLAENQMVSDSNNNRQFVFSGLTPGVVYTAACMIDASVGSLFLTVNGRIYELSVTSNLAAPLLAGTAPN